MTFLFILIGAALAPFVCAGMFEENTGWTSALLGACIGLLLGQLRRVRARVGELERKISALRLQAMSSVVELPAPAPVVEPSSGAPVAPPLPAPVPTPLPEAPAAASADIARLAQVDAQVASPVLARPDAITRFTARVKQWFTEGNVPVKVGVIVLFLGVGALLKYAADSGWLRVPIELRLAGVAAAALAALVFAWRKRESHRPFALSLQGGAIGVLILTIFAAFRLYSVVPSGLAFALLVIVVAGAGALAVLQDTLALAVLAIVGGFLAPILVATDSGNHVALFSYYAVLNAAIFAIAWVRPWRPLNLLGFAFTFVIGTAWGITRYRHELFASTEPFLLLFFAFYLFIPILYALRQAPARRDLIDGSLVFGTPLIAFALQAGLLLPERMPLAYSALGAGAIYTAVAALELRRLGLRLLGESHALLAFGFATLAVPLALSARTTASTWALEGAAVLWLGLRQQRRIPRWIGYALQVCAGMAFLYGYEDTVDHTAILNGAFCGALLLALAGLVSARLLSRADARAPLTVLLFVWAWGWWLLAWGNEIDRFASSLMKANWWLVLIAMTGHAGSEGLRRLNWREAAWPLLAMFALAPLYAIAMGLDGRGPLEGWAAAAWALWLLSALRGLFDLAFCQHSVRHLAHFVFLWTVAFALGVEFAHIAHAHLALGDVWIGLGALAPFAALFWFALVRAEFVRWPDPDAAERLRHALLTGVAAVLGIAWFAGLFVEGAPDPVPFVPLLNPLELSQIGFLLLLLAWYRRAATEGRTLFNAELRARLLSVAFVVLLTAITLRGVHFLGGVPWDESLRASALAQAALSVVWTVAGIAAMLLGKRRGSRAVWIGGAALMALVIVKLLLVDRQHLHDLTAIVGVLVVGVLLVGVGYFAPAPPRVSGENQ
jgi:uncharacterized membrane protein